MFRAFLCSLMSIFFTFSLFGQEPVRKKSMNTDQEFQQFLDEFVPKVSTKAKQLNQLYWILETTGAKDAADLVGQMQTEIKLLFSDRLTYEKLLQWKKQKVKDPVLQRELTLFVRDFKENMLPKELLQEISEKEAALALTYANFRPNYQGKPISENQIRDILREEINPKVRKDIWTLSKDIGNQMAPKVLELVALRNKAAKALGYDNYFQMQLDLQEVDEAWLFSTFDDLVKRSEKAYSRLSEEMRKSLAKKFSVAEEEIGPWAWGDPFCQEDPIDTKELDGLVKDLDFVKITKEFYQKMGFDISPILEKSDLYERAGKNQHAFCINIDRKADIRTLNNLQPNLRWLDTILHEFGHAVYETGLDQKLPWRLREPPHMITTEAMALIAGRQAYKTDFYQKIAKLGSDKQALMKKAELSQKRRQLVFSRWAIVMTYFEKELYKNPSQDLNKLWWSLVEKYQKVTPPKSREKNADWASKYHMALAPVYYYSYLLGEMFASSMNDLFIEKLHTNNLWDAKVGSLLKKELFAPGDRYSWDLLIEKIIKQKLNANAWLKEFADTEKQP